MWNPEAQPIWTRRERAREDRRLAEPLEPARRLFVLRQTADEARWAGMEKYIKVGFWGTNIGLLMMVGMSLFPGGVLQVWDVVQHGYWHARSVAYTGTETARLLEWMRMPGDLVFIIFGAVPLAIGAIKGYIGVRLIGK